MSRARSRGPRRVPCGRFQGRELAQCNQRLAIMEDVFGIVRGFTEMVLRDEATLTQQLGLAAYSQLVKDMTTFLEIADDREQVHALLNARTVQAGVDLSSIPAAQRRLVHLTTFLKRASLSSFTGPEVFPPRPSRSKPFFR